MKKSKSQKSSLEKGSENITTGDDFLIVGIGASAGGIQALKVFFENVPADSDIAYVVILHLSPDHDSKLAEVLQTVASIPVTQVTEKVRVEPNHVYVVPPNKSLSMVDGYIVVSPIHTIEERRAPVDIFFRTLAESHHDRAVAVVLSGTGANGSMGIKRVNERGGAAFVQNPREAEYSDMPRNSIATDLIDAILNVAEIPAKIIAYKENLGKVEIQVKPESRPDKQSQALREIFTQLRVHTGHDFSNYKRPTLLRRIQRRINVHQLPDLPAYAVFIRDNAEEIRALLKDLLISVTHFFRDKEAFTVLEQDTLPRILHGKSGTDQIRVWITGCATGEEAYSVAMLLAERLIDAPDAPDIQIFATDIDEQAIAIAREGFYTLNDAADVSPERLRRFFTKETGGYRVRRELREMILFANHNLLKDPPFSRLDLATCRNLLIYLNPSAQERVMETLHFALNPGGYLLLGASESIDGAGDLYATVSKERRIYQNRQTAMRLPFPVSDLSPLQQFDQPRPAAAQGQENHALKRISYADLHQRLLEQYAPPSIVVNENYDVVHLSERAGRYLQIAGGEPSMNLLKVIREELRPELRTALFQAVQRQTNVEINNLTIRIDNSVETINIYVRPVLRQGDTARGFLLVLFEQTHKTDAESEAVFTSHEPIADQLEEELTRSKTQFRTAVEQHEIQAEELKASNEELQAMNEELRSTSEELETGKEELQSVNEELVTVNQELKIKIEEVIQTGSDLNNLINSTDIGTMFLDRTFRINLFTPAARRIFNLLPADFGRQLSDITNRLESQDFIADMETVLEKLQPVEREVRTTDNHIFTMRVLPYRTKEDKINGVVLTFFDITEHKHAEEAKSFLASIVEFSQDSVITINFDGNITSWNKAAEWLYGYPAAEAIGKPLTMLTMPEDLKRVLSNIDKIKHSEKVEIFDSVRLNKDGREMNLEVVLSPVKDAAGKVIGVSTIARDVTERRNAEEASRKIGERYRILFDLVPVAVYTCDADGVIGEYNRRAVELWGREPEKNNSGEVYCGSFKIFYPDGSFMPHEKCPMARALRGETLEASDLEIIVEQPNGMRKTVVVNPRTLKDENGEIIGAINCLYDITERKQAEESIRFQAHLLNTVEQSVIATDLDGAIIYWNQFAERLYGWTAEQAKGRNIIDLTTPDMMTDQAVEIMSRLRQGEGWSGEFTVRRRDGKIFPAQVFNSPIADDKGTLIGIIGISVDITERKQAEEQLSKTAEQLERQSRIFNTTLSAITDFAYIFDRDGRFIYANQPLLELLGLTFDEITGKNFFELPYPKDLAERLDKQIQEVIETKNIVVDETPFTNPTGYSGFYEYIFSPVFAVDGTVEVVAGSTRETTMRRQTEQALRESEERLRLLIESASDYAIFTMTLDNRINIWNTGAEKVFGWTESEALGQSGEIIFTPEDRKAGAPEQEIKTAIKNGRAPDERFHLRKDGSRFYVSGVMMLLKDAAGNVQGFAKIARDMTEQLQAEKALRDKEILQKLVGAQEDERKRIARDLHDELGQQLTALRLKLESARKICEEEEVCSKIDEIQVLAKRIDNDVDFLAWELRPAVLDDLGLTIALDNYLKEWSRHSGVTAEFHGNGLKQARLAPEIEINFYRIAQEALNNAHKHAQANRVSLLLEQRDGQVVMIIEDDGIGFEPENKLNRNKGLGLIGMHERAALVGGTLEIESAPGSGTTIYVRVPISLTETKDS